MRIVLIVLLSVVSAFAQAANGLAKISGHTNGAQSKPLSKTVLTLQVLGNPGQEVPRGKPYQVTSDAQGNFSFDGVDPGRYYLSAGHPGYLLTSYGSPKPGMPPKLIVLALGQEVKDIVIEMVPEAVISGRVLDEEGEPMPRVTVGALRPSYTIAGERFYQNIQSLTTDENGKYRLAQLPAGKYIVMAVPMQRPGPRPQQPGPEMSQLRTYYPSAPDEPAAEAIQLVTGAQETGRDIRMRLGPVFHVKGVVPPDLRPRPGQLARVSLSGRDAAGRAMASFGAMVNPDGSFDVAGVPAGPYTLNVSSVGNGELSKIIAVQHVDAGPSLSQPVNLQPLATLTVTGTAKGDVPLTQVRVLLRSMAATVGNAIQVPPAEVKADGAFVVRDIVPGQYRVAYTGLPEVAYVKSLKLAGKERLGVGIDLSDGVPGPLEVTFASDGAKLTGVVKDRQGAAVSVCMIALTPDDNSRTDRYRQIPCTPDGHFALALVPPGKYRIHAYEYLDPSLRYDPAFLKERAKDGQAVTVAPSTAQDLSLTLQ